VTSQCKAKIVKYALEHGNSAAARKYTSELKGKFKQEHCSKLGESVHSRMGEEKKTG